MYGQYRRACDHKQRFLFVLCHGGLLGFCFFNDFLLPEVAGIEDINCVVVVGFSFKSKKKPTKRDTTDILASKGFGSWLFNFDLTSFL